MFSEAATWGWDLAAPDLARRPFGALPPPCPGIACPSVSAVSHGCLSSLSATVSLNMSASAPNCSCCDTAHLNVGGGAALLCRGTDPGGHPAAPGPPGHVSHTHPSQKRQYLPGGLMWFGGLPWAAERAARNSVVGQTGHVPSHSVLLCGVDVSSRGTERRPPLPPSEIRTPAVAAPASVHVQGTVAAPRTPAAAHRPREV